MKVLVLSGGGSHGARQVGAIQALLESGNQYDAIVGNSVGAVNGAALDSVGLEGLRSFWLELNGRGSVMSWNWSWPWNWTGFYDFDPLKKKLLKSLKQNPASSSVYVASTDLGSLRVGYKNLGLSAEEDAETIIESCSVSPIHALSRSQKMDGGHREIAPVEFAYDILGATAVDVVCCDPVDKTIQDWKPSGWVPLLSCALRALEASLAEILKTDLDNHSEARVFEPKDIVPVNSLDYNAKEIAMMIDEGYQTTLEQLRA